MSTRDEDERERARLEREARRSARADRAASAQRPHARERVENALARSKSRKPAARPVPPNGNGDAPPPAARAPHRHGRFFLPLVIGLTVIALAAAWFLVSLYQPGHGSGSGRVAVVIPRGSSLGQIANRLGGAGVIAHPFFFKLRVRMAG